MYHVSVLECRSEDAELCLIVMAGSWCHSNEHQWKGGFSRTPSGKTGRTVQNEDKKVGAPTAGGDGKTEGDCVR